MLGLIGTAASVAGNEAAIRFGRRRLIAAAMIGSALLAGLLARCGHDSYPLAVALMLLYGAVIWLDSASLTAGTAGTAEPSRRGATLAVHSTLGYLGGFVGPLAVGLGARPRRRQHGRGMERRVRDDRRPDGAGAGDVSRDASARTCRRPRRVTGPGAASPRTQRLTPAGRHTFCALFSQKLHKLLIIRDISKTPMRKTPECQQFRNEVTPSPR